MSVDGATASLQHVDDIREALANPLVHAVLVAALEQSVRDSGEVISHWRLGWPSVGASR
jgi:hypothetical protein